MIFEKVIQRYQMLFNPQESELAKDIETLIQDGWEPYGNPMMIYTEDALVLAQAMVLKVPDPSIKNGLSYVTLSSDTPDGLDKQVLSYTDAEWVPRGNMQVSNGVLYQTMVGLDSITPDEYAKIEMIVAARRAAKAAKADGEEPSCSP